MRLIDWQPKYAAAGLWLFPLHHGSKAPAVKGYLKAGPVASNRYAERFADRELFGFACGRKSGITILDIDTPNVKYLWTALDKHGRTPVVVETASGKYHAWYKWNGEGRHIRPWGHLPIDVLGGGYAVAPPSQMPGSLRGRYSFITGGLEEIPNLPILREVDDLGAARSIQKINGVPASDLVVAGAAKGARSIGALNFALCEAPNCANQDELMDRVRAWGATCEPPLEEHKIMKAVQSAWKYETTGSNWVAMAHANEIEDMISAGRAQQDAYLLLQWLRVKEGTNRDRPFWIATGLAKIFGWKPTRFRAARRLLEKSYIREVHHGNQFTGPSLFAWQRRAMSRMEQLSL
jgi:hypothetical protein